MSWPCSSFVAQNLHTMGKPSLHHLIRALTLLFLLPLLAGTATADNGGGLPDLIVNEIQSANIDQFLDPSWNYGGWVELYNAGSSSITLKGYWVSDDPTNLKQVHITEPIAIAPGSYYNLWFDHYDKYCPTQVDMKLDVEGGTFYLSDANGNLIISQSYPQAVSRCSYARKSLDSDEWGMTSTPSPEASNEGSVFCSSRLEAPSVDHDSQFFTAPLTVRVDIPEGTTLRYTTDGSAPTATNGMTSEDGLFNVESQTTTYRFCLIEEGFLPSPVVTRTFIYKDKDFPLPVFTISTADDNLYCDENGIFVYNNRYNEWDRPVNFEYFDEEGLMEVNQETAIERCGGVSRDRTPYSFKVKANKRYELQNYLPYDFFSEKPYLKHKTLQIRNGGGDTECRIKDAALQEIVLRSGLDVDCQGYQPVMHYINGKYAGVINMREPNNKDYVYANYGLDDDEIDQFEMSALTGYVQKCGTYESMQRWYDLAQQCGSSDEAYEELKAMVDIDEYCNYMAVQLYLGNNDWPRNNFKGFKPITDGGKYRLVVFDIDNALSLDISAFTAFASCQIYTFSPYGEDIDYITKEIELVTIFLNMLANDSFRKQFIDTFCIVAGSVFEPSRCKEIINELCDRVSDSQSIDSELYGSGSTPWSTANSMISSLSSSRQATMVSALKSYSPMKLSSASVQRVTLSANIDEARLLINDIPVPTNKFSGKLFPPIVLKAEAPAGYTFLGWREGDTYISKDEKYLLFYSTSPLSIVACYEKMDEGSLSTAPIVINEVSASNSVNVNEYFKKDDWVELYNTTSEDIDLEGMYLSDNSSKPHKYQVTAEGTGVSTIIKAHDYKIIWCSQRETDKELHASFKLGNSNGELVRIEAEDGSWADSLVYCSMNGDQSVGRYPDGGTDVYLMTSPTIKKSNRMNSYATLWSSTGIDSTEGDESGGASRSGGLSIAYGRDCLWVKNEDCPLTSVSVHSTSGMTLMIFSLDTSTGLAKVGLASLPRGVYVATARDGEGRCVQTKFVMK